MYIDNKLVSVASSEATNINKINIKSTFADQVCYIDNLVIKGLNSIAETPSIATDAANKKLTGFADGSEYTINGEAAVISDGAVDIKSDWYGTTVSIIKKGSTENLIADSKVQTLEIPSEPSISNAATAKITMFTPKSSSTSAGLAVTVGDEDINKITVKIGEKEIISYPVSGKIEAGKTVNFGILVRRAISQNDITVEVDGKAISVN